jgi:hypothetical protein
LSANSWPNIDERDWLWTFSFCTHRQGLPGIDS